jgi:hypothetical protein
LSNLPAASRSIAPAAAARRHHFRCGAKPLHPSRPHMPAHLRNIVAQRFSETAQHFLAPGE